MAITVMAVTRVIGLGLGVGLAVASCAAVRAQDIASGMADAGVVKERKVLMSEMAASMKRILFSLASAAPGDGGIAADARTLVLHAGEIGRLFPDGSLGGSTEASPEIRRRRDEFRELAEETAGLADALLRAVEFGERDTALRRFPALGRSCSDCHARFRIPDEAEE
ncbi:MAG: cytochrome c [Acetobacterales bacterium]